MRGGKYLLLILGALSTLCIITSYSCSSADKDNPDPDLYNFVVADECDNPPELSFNLQPATLIPIEGQDQSFTLLGESGAQTIVDDLTSEELLCALDISDETALVFEAVEQLIIDGKNSEARNLLSTLLDALKLAVKVNYETNSTDIESSAERQKVRELLRAAGYDMKAGGDGQSYLNQARDKYTAWATSNISNATSIKELLKIAAEAQLLGLDDLSDSAIAKTTEIAKMQLEEKLNSFDPCSATNEEAGDLLDQLAKEMILTGEQGSNYNKTLEKAGQAFIKNGINEDFVKQTFGEYIEAPVCSYLFEWSRTVSDGWIFKGNGSSCDGINWKGSVTLSGVNTSGGSISSSGDFVFAIAEGTNTGFTTVPTAGVATFDGNPLSFSDPIPMQFVFLKDDLQAQITMASDGSGRMSTQVGDIAFASIFTSEPIFTVDLFKNPDCGN